MDFTMIRTAHALLFAGQPLATLLGQALEAASLAVSIHESGPDALEAAFRAQPDLVVIEAGLVDANGVDLLTAVRLLSDVPVVVIGRDDSECAAVAALHGGADRYMPLPLRVDEFGATAAAILRRAQGTKVAPVTYADGALQVDFQTYTVRVHDEDVALTPVEFRVLAAFVNNPGLTLTPEAILEAAWGHSNLPRGRVKLYIGYLRRKFRAADVDLDIKTVRGFGYRYVPAPGGLDRELEALMGQLEDVRGPSGQPFFPTVAARHELQRALVAD
jgi:two-component system KDP operon response regulator KdpE